MHGALVMEVDGERRQYIAREHSRRTGFSLGLKYELSQGEMFSFIIALRARSIQ